MLRPEPLRRMDTTKQGTTGFAATGGVEVSRHGSDPLRNPDTAENPAAHRANPANRAYLKKVVPPTCWAG